MEPDEELFSRARKSMRTVRENDVAVLEIVAEIGAANAAATAGYPSTERLLEDLFLLDRRDAKRLVRHAAALLPRSALSGEPLPPAAPATARAAAEGAVAAAHVDVVLDTLDRLARVPGLGHDTLAAAEETLAEHARRNPPRMLARIAARLVAVLDPDGVVPDGGSEPADELSLGTRRDGTVVGRFAIHGTADRDLLREVFDALSAPAGPDDPRGLDQRRAEALLDLLAQAVSPSGLAAEVDTDLGSGSCADADAGPESGATREPAHVTGAVPSTGEPDALPPGGPDALPPGGPDALPSDGSSESDALPPDADPAVSSNAVSFESAEAGAADGDGGTETASGPSSRSSRPHERHGERPPERWGERRPRPSRTPGRATFTVTMPLDWLRRHVGHATSDSEESIGPAEARRLACDAGVVPMVLGTHEQPLDVGRLSYTIPEGMRRALIHRDGGCAFPGCTRRPGRCAAHHVRHWVDGGATELNNTTLLCRYHHRLIHSDHWRIQMRNGRPWFVPPRWIDPDRAPRPGGRHPVT